MKRPAALLRPLWLARRHQPVQVGREVASATILPATAGLGAAVGTAANSVAALAGLTGAVAGIAALFRREYTITGRMVDMKPETAQILMAEALVDQADSMSSKARPCTPSPATSHSPWRRSRTP